MCSARRISSMALVLIFASWFIVQLSLAGTHVFRPEDRSVYLDQRDPNNNWVSKTGLLVVSQINENARTVLHFDLGGVVPNPASITQAKLHLYHYRGGNYSGSRTINVYPLTSNFDESTATWNYPWSAPGGDYDNGISASAEVLEVWENWVEWDVTDLLKNSWNNISSNGFLIKDPVEDTPSDGPYVRFHSHRADSLPYLEVTFTEQEIPTLTEWGLIIFGLVLMGFMTWVFLRRRQAGLDLR
jgi:hypothetical protein